jgi:hypothetical protein
MRKIVIFMAVILSSAILASAQQSATATLSGRVTDPAGAVIVGVKVTAAQKTTGSKRETVTNSEGLYVFTNLPPGEGEEPLVNTSNGLVEGVIKPREISTLPLNGRN